MSPIRRSEGARQRILSALDSTKLVQGYLGNRIYSLWPMRCRCRRVDKISRKKRGLMRGQHELKTIRLMNLSVVCALHPKTNKRTIADRRLIFKQGAYNNLSAFIFSPVIDAHSRLRFLNTPAAPADFFA
jgi:hypothetical protein